MTTTEPTAEAVKQTLAEYERLAISTGATVQIDAPEFSENGVDWSPVWGAGEGHVLPSFARVTVHRDGIPTTVYVAWDEALPAEESWRALWQRKPMTLFGAFTIRAALRRAFRDVIGDRHEPDDLPDTPPAAETPAETVDWEARIAAASTPAEVVQVHNAAKAARAMTPALEVALRKKARDMIHPAAEALVAAASVRAESAKMPDPQPFARPRPTPPSIRPEDTVRRRPAGKGKK